MSQNKNIFQILRNRPKEQIVELNGWVKSCRHSKNVSFIDLNDGSCLNNLQIIVEPNLANYQAEIQTIGTGCAIKVSGRLQDSPAKGQQLELHAESVAIIGKTAPAYPLQKKRHSFEFLREIAHLRPRTNSLGAVARIRSSLSFAVHRFFQERDFCHIHTPIISTGDCEGAGETFTVTALTLDDFQKSNGNKNLWQDDFFGRQANLTVSGQLEAEAYAMALGNVYTFGPTFRAEHSNTSRHLAEFWMIEPEVAFCDLEGDIALAEEFIKFLVQHALENCREDLEIFGSHIDKGLFERLEKVGTKPFARLSYSEAITTLEGSGKKFKYPVKWGIDLQSEHERFLCEEIFDGPLVLSNYPKDIKPFYMRLNDDAKTVAAMDIMLPGIGEIIGGSQREERLEPLIARMTELEMELDGYQWYLDLRRYGSAPHAGFGLGFERLIQYITGIPNIREVIPFPRTPGSAGF